MILMSLAITTLNPFFLYTYPYNGYSKGKKCKNEGNILSVKNIITS